MDSPTTPPTSLPIPIEVVYIMKQLDAAGYECYLVGGAVRDLLQGRDHIVDFDFTTNATPEQILKVFPESFYENEYGTVMITPPEIWKVLPHKLDDLEMAERLLPNDTNRENRIIDISAATKIHVSLQQEVISDDQKASKVLSKLKNFEITTFRSDGAYQNHRKPDQVSWGENIEDDLERRDFTINAMAIQLSSDVLSTALETKKTSTVLDTQLNSTLSSSDYTIIDPFNGYTDLQNKLVKTVGIAEDRFTEDALRLLRAIRFAVQLEATIDQDTVQAIKKKADLLSFVSWERISTEFLKMISSKQPKRAIELLDETGLLQTVLPELLEAKNVEQGGHHTTDVWTHSLDALEASPATDPIVRLATLIHDIAKPQTMKLINGQPTFYNHEVIGARIAKKIGQRLKLSKKDIDRLFILVRFHMFHYQEQNSDASIRRFMRNVGLEHLDDILDVREADRLGSGARKTSWRLEEMKQRMIEQLHQPMEVTDLAINGTDLMEEFSLKPGPILGTILTELLQVVLNDPDQNTRENLLKLSTTIIEQQNQ